LADEEETAKTIRRTMERCGYLADTHTAVALSAAEQYIAETDDRKPMVVASTASPYKFANDVYNSLYGETPSDPLAALDKLSERTATEIPYPLCGIGERKVRFEATVAPADMKASVMEFAKK
jgi:threonine synthase